MEKGMGASGVTLECKHNHDVNGDRSVIERPNAERTAYVKVSNGDRARALLLAEQKSRYQETTDDKKCALPIRPDEAPEGLPASDKREYSTRNETRSRR